MKKRKVVEFEAGDVVVLKSGGPAMTVSRAGDDGNCYCQWFRYDGEGVPIELKCDPFAFAALELE